MPKRVLAALVLLFSLCAAAQAQGNRLGISAYALGGYNVRSVAFTGPFSNASTVDLSTYDLDCGLSLRYALFSFLTVSASGGLVYFPSFTDVVQQKLSIFYYNSDEDGTGGYLAADLYLNVPVVPINLFAGYKYSFYGPGLLSYVEGTQALRLGMDVVVTRNYYPEIVVEIPLASGSFADQGDTFALTNAYSLQVMLIVVL